MIFNLGALLDLLAIGCAFVVIARLYHCENRIGELEQQRDYLRHRCAVLEKGNQALAGRLRQANAEVRRLVVRAHLNGRIDR